MRCVSEEHSATVNVWSVLCVANARKYSSVYTSLSGLALCKQAGPGVSLQFAGLALPFLGLAALPASPSRFWDALCCDWFDLVSAL
mmetsp:Transcript_42389/g.106948  ORF Transcript_42389/g.106948 Transcript_42389/m.106948 type:complete len:86 (-) Transcript_42389:1324-1581(-)